MGCRPESTLREALCAAAWKLTGTECSGSPLSEAQRLSSPMGDKQRKIVGGPRSSQGGSPVGCRSESTLREALCAAAWKLTGTVLWQPAFRSPAALRPDG